MSTDPAAFASFLRPLSTAPRDGTWVLVSWLRTDPAPGEPKRCFEVAHFQEIKGIGGRWFSDGAQYLGREDGRTGPNDSCPLDSWTPLPLHPDECKTKNE